MMPENKSYDDLISQIERLVESGRNKAVIAVNQVMVATYWAVGRYIVEYEQQGNEKSEYGSQLLKRLSSDLSIRLGNGYSHSHLNYMRMFFQAHPILETVSPKLSWGHWFEILKISDPLERSFYQKQTEHEGWGVRELKRQKKSMLFHRLAATKDKEGILKLAKDGQFVEIPADLIRDPYILEFLKIPEPIIWHEKDLEKRLIEQLQEFQPRQVFCYTLPNASPAPPQCLRPAACVQHNEQIV